MIPACQVVALVFVLLLVVMPGVGLAAYSFGWYWRGRFEKTRR